MARFFNTARNNKAAPVRRTRHGRFRIFIVLRDDVKQGEEITIPYGPDFDIELRDSESGSDDDDDDNDD